MPTPLLTRAARPSTFEVLALDERGTAVTTVVLADKLRHWQREGGDVAIVIGGPDGLD